MSLYKLLLALCAALAAGLVMQQPIRAYASYDLGLRTATIALPGQFHYWYSGQEGESYELWIDPQTLRVGYDPQQAVWYESFVIADVGDLRTVGASLHLSSMSASPAATFSIQAVGVQHAVPESGDLAWRVGWGAIPKEICGFSDGMYDVQPSGTGRYQGWCLCAESGYGDFAGAGTPDAPYARVYAVPEVPTAAAVLGAVLVLALGVAIRGRPGRILVWSLILFALFVSASIADEWFAADSDPGALENIEGSQQFPSTRDLPADYVCLPTFPRLVWSFGCAPTSGAMIVGHLDNSGFPNMWTNSDYPAFPTTGVPSDNGPFLRRDGAGQPLDDVEMYPSRCALSASEMGVFGLTEKGHVDDYWQYAPFTDLAQAYANHQLVGAYDGYCKNSSGNLQWTSHEATRGRDCVADHMGTSAYYYRGQADSISQYIVAILGPPASVFGTSVTWQPYAWPTPNAQGASYLDANYGLTRYIVECAGYHPRTTVWTANGNAYSRDDVDSYYNRGIKGAKLINGVPNTEGVIADDIRAEIDAGWPVIALLDEYNQFNTRTGGHAFPVFGYKQEQVNGVDRLRLLAYDTWYQDKASLLSYSTFFFPTVDEAHDLNVMSLTRQGITPVRYYKVYAFAFLHVTNHPRCDAPLPDAQASTDVVHNDEFDLVMAGQGETGRQAFSTCNQVYYSETGDPSPTSAHASITSGVATVHMDHDCSIAFRTYKDPEQHDGYIASKVAHRVFSVFSANKNIKKNADGASVTMVNGIVTHVVDADTFYIEERDRRLFGVQVRMASHGLSRGDQIQVLTGTVGTDSSANERYVTAAGITKYTTTATTEPFHMSNKCIGGGDFLPAGGSGTNYGQCGVSGGRGVNNIAMLVRTAGNVTAIDSAQTPAWFTISDGSGAIDADGNSGVRISAVGSMPSGLAVGNHVSATGICQLQFGANLWYPIILTRDSGDVVVY